MALPSYTPLGFRLWHYGFLGLCSLIFLFLVAPILVVVPLSFNAGTYFTFSDAMLRLDPDAFSLRWYREIFDPPNRPGLQGNEWFIAAKNSLFIATLASLVATALGTVAALGLSRPEMPLRRAITAVLISPLIVPIVITAAGMLFFYSTLGLAYTFPGLILAHAALGTPFVVITVTATLSGQDPAFVRASLSLGASPIYTFFKVTVPLILPGVITGALFAFVTSLDEVVVVLFMSAQEHVTVPRLMWGGIRQEITLTILAVATIMIVLSIFLLLTVELLRRRNERLRGLSPG